MDFLLIVLAIAGVVFAVVMLVLAFRATRMERESDARVQRLQTLAAGSVLFGADALDEPDDKAFELLDEHAVRETPPPVRPVTVDTTANAYSFVMTVPAGAGRMPGSFYRAQRGSRS
jgi:hypothetical protein